MQLTKDQCDAQIAQIQKQIPELQGQLQQLIGYRQALVEMEEGKNEKEDEAVEQFTNLLACGLLQPAGGTGQAKVFWGPYDRPDKGDVAYLLSKQNEVSTALPTALSHGTL